jgi:hypothetical protein
MKMRMGIAVACAAAAVLAGARPAAADTIITQWTFENQPITTPPPYNNSPIPSTGSGTAIVLGMTNNYGTPNPSFAAADILNDFPTGNNNSHFWRIRGQGSLDGTNTPAANGWSSLAPQYTQGAEFDVSTKGYTGIKVSFDWEATPKGVRNIVLQYNPNVANPNGWVNAGYYTALGEPNWNFGNVVDLSSISSIANDPNFGIRMVSAYDPTLGFYTQAGSPTAPLNNSSGNIRFDNVTVTGTVIVPEPASLLLFGVAGGLGLLYGRRRWGRKLG